MLAGRAERGIVIGDHRDVRVSVRLTNPVCPTTNPSHLAKGAAAVMRQMACGRWIRWNHSEHSGHSAQQDGILASNHEHSAVKEGPVALVESDVALLGHRAASEPRPVNCAAPGRHLKHHHRRPSNVRLAS